MALLAAGVGGCVGDGDVPDADDTQVPFVPFVGDEAAPDVTTDRLCDEAADPHGAADKTFLHCRVEGASFATDAPAGRDLEVTVWNIERGLELDEQLAAWADGTLPRPDVLLASELDRGCSRSGSRNVPREIADALGMAYVFAVEFIELPREGGSGGSIETTCEHGNALFSRLPLGNVEAFFHQANDSWYTPPEDFDGRGEPRLGGRVALQADAQLADGSLLRLLTIHFESRPSAHDIQVAQAEEIATRVEASPVPVLVGGDTNSFGYSVDVFSGRTDADTVTDATIGPILRAGTVDAHASLPAEARPTRSGVVIDLLLGRDVTFTDPWVCDEACDALSDHRAVGATTTVR